MYLYIIKLCILGLILCTFAIAIYRIVKFLFKKIKLFILSKYYSPIDQYIKMDEFLLCTPFIKAFIIFLFSVSMFLGSLIIAYLDENEIFMATISTILFGTATIFSIWLAMPKSSYLKINNNGLEIKSLWRTYNINWDKINSFETIELINYIRGIKTRNKFVSINANHKNAFNRKVSLRKIESTGAYLLPDNYGIKHEELTNLLNIKRQQFLKNC